jgi:ribonuclease E
MMINAKPEIQTALIDGVLFDYDVEFLHNEDQGRTLRARVVGRAPACRPGWRSQQGGASCLGELPGTSPWHPQARIPGTALSGGEQEILVQAVREELGTKGAMMSTGQVSLAGRYLVIHAGQPRQRHQPQDRRQR